MAEKKRPTDPRFADSIKAIMETQAFLEDAVNNPDKITRIPVVRVGFGKFSPQLSNAFWTEALN